MARGRVGETIPCQRRQPRLAVWPRRGSQEEEEEAAASSTALVGSPGSPFSAPARGSGSVSANGSQQGKEKPTPFVRRAQERRGLRGGLSANTHWFFPWRRRRLPCVARWSLQPETRLTSYSQQQHMAGARAALGVLAANGWDA